MRLQMRMPLNEASQCQPCCDQRGVKGACWLLGTTNGLLMQGVGAFEGLGSSWPPCRVIKLRH